MNDDARLIQQICAGRVRKPERLPAKARRRLPTWIRVLLVALLAMAMLFSYMLYDLWSVSQAFQREHRDKILLLMRELIERRSSSLMAQAHPELLAELDSAGLRNPGDALIQAHENYPDGLFGNQRLRFFCTVSANGRSGGLEVDLRFDSSTGKYMVTGLRRWDRPHQATAAR